MHRFVATKQPRLRAAVLHNMRQFCDRVLTEAVTATPQA